ncbi:unnamed protein product [Chondrus crispus]|uniref:Single-stranded DNA binding protein Ssb-like OB fold domain-containing protein n=1 Tax=Chondrus crispus TaxID=2769 RepID=R7QI28_CHOCR|nr:unnamed protein product [Chondrus crispus]CDF37060.1 unnamed protein product [Chondrus crispus]|eukprot:XP_005716879.1 unnamed protein product [Chondrus crispus]
MASLNRNKPKYVKLDRLAPRTHDHCVIVKVLEKQSLNKKESATVEGRREQVLVGDETGCMYMRAHNGE